MPQAVPSPEAPLCPELDRSSESAAAPLAEPDRVVLVPLDSSEVRRVAMATGPSFDTWKAYWDTLGPHERDPLTDPAWVAGELAGRLAAAPPESFAMFVLAGNEVQSVMPVTHQGGGALRHTSGFQCHSWALASSHQSAALDALFRSRVDDHRVRSLALDRIEETHSLLRGPGRLSNRVHFRSQIEFPEGYEALLASMTSRVRSGVRRLRRRVERDHEVELEAVTAGVEMDAAFNRFLDVDARSWKRKDGSLLREDPPQRDAIRTSMRHCARDGRAVAHFLRVDGIDIAAQLSVAIDEVLYLVKTSHDEEWANYGAGKLLLAETIRVWCPENEIRAVNMITGLTWHLQWKPRQIETRALWLLSPGLRGVAANLLDVPPRERVKYHLRQNGLEAPVRRLLRRGDR